MSTEKMIKGEKKKRKIKKKNGERKKAGKDSHDLKINGERVL
jgi:hypothetical protein